jgi:DNA-binding transcriptional regulator YiaG
MNMNQGFYQYKECGLDNIYLSNGYKIINTDRGEAISIHDIDGLHRAIGMHLVFSKKDLSGGELRFLRHEMLMSQKTLATLVGMSEQAIRRWENGKTSIPKSSERLIRLLYGEKTLNQHGKIAEALKKIANLEDQFDSKKIVFNDTIKGWKAAA